MDKRSYETPQLQTLGSVQELTANGIEKCIGSADLTLPRNPPETGDLICTIDGPG